MDQVSDQIPNITKNLNQKVQEIENQQNNENNEENEEDKENNLIIDTVEFKSIQSTNKKFLAELYELKKAKHLADLQAKKEQEFQSELDKKDYEINKWKKQCREVYQKETMLMQNFLSHKDTEIQTMQKYIQEKHKELKKLEQKEQALQNQKPQENMNTKLQKQNQIKVKILKNPKNIKKMQDIEKYMTTYKQNNSSYKDFCLSKSQSDSSCAPPLSIPLIISQNQNQNYNQNITQQKIDGFLQTVTSSEQTFQQFFPLFDKNFSIKNPNVQVARSMYYFARPLEGYKNSITDVDVQTEKFKLWLRGFYDYIDEDQNSDTMEIMYLNQISILDYSQVQIGKDIIFSMLSAIFVTIYSCFHTKSISVGLIGSLLIIIAFPSSYFFYRLVLQIDFFISLHISVLFLLLGIGADDIFVFYDSFQQAGQISLIKDDLLKRTSYAYRRASKAMLITSCTTIISFLATAISKLIPIMTYGIFAAINILISYLLVITAFPAFLVWREKRNQQKNNQNQPQNAKVSNTNENDIVKENDDIENKINQQQNQNNNNNQNKSQQKQQNYQEHQNNLSKIQFFFKNKWNIWIFKARYPIIFFFLGLLAFKIFATTQLEIPTEPPLMIKDHHFLLKALKLVRYNFQTGGNDGNSITINFVWGIKGVNQENTKTYDPQDRGQIVYDNDFDISSQQNQLRMLEICEIIKSKKYKNLVSQNENAVECFMEDFKLFANQEFGEFPVPQNQFNSIFKQFLNSEQGFKAKQSGNIGFIDNKIKYFILPFTGNELEINGRDILAPLFDEYEQFITEINKNSQKGINKAFQSSGSWQWMVSEKELLDGAIQGIIISLSLAFIILLISTKNIIISIYSIICIIGVVLGVFMVIWAKGWTFGTFESMNSIIIIGLSVDYIVHLANTYCESEKQDKFQRVEDMLTIMGVSVLGGGCTTLGAGLFLFGGKLVFFEIMGTLVSSTIGFSLLWSLIFFPALCHTIGPSGNFGDLRYLFTKLLNKKQVQQIKK